MGNSLLISACNCRDLGGHQGADGRITAYGRFWRSDAPRGNADADAETLLRHGMDTVIDLRTAEEAEKSSDPLAVQEGFRYRLLSVDEGSAPPARAEDVPDSYMAIAAAAVMPRVYRCLAEAPRGVLFHCTAGKDRSGVVSAVLLLHAGVGDGEIIADYVLSRENNRERLEAFLKKHPEVDRNTVLAREESMEGFLRLFRERYGGTDGYFRALGLREETGRALRRKLLCKENGF